MKKRNRYTEDFACKIYYWSLLEETHSSLVTKFSVPRGSIKGLIKRGKKISEENESKRNSFLKGNK